MSAGATDKPTVMHTHDVLHALHKHYPADKGWVCIPEVSNGNTRNRRQCDLMALQLWASAGQHLHGHEIKVSRGDWLREVRDLTKATAFTQHCHAWWIVAPARVVATEELPAEWGLKEVTTRGVKIIKRAAIQERPGLSWPMIASLFSAYERRSESAQLFQRMLGDERERARKAFEQRIADAEIRSRGAVARAKQDLDQVLAIVEKIEAIIGCKLMSTWAHDEQEAGMEKLARAAALSRNEQELAESERKLLSRAKAICESLEAQ